MLSSKEFLLTKDKDIFKIQNDVREELKVFIKKFKNKGISEKLLSDILDKVLLNTKMTLGEYRNEISLLDFIHNNEITFRKFIKINKSTKLGKPFSIPDINLSVKNGELVLVDETEEKFLIVANTGRPILLIDELVLYPIPTDRESLVFNSPFPITQCYLKPKNTEQFKKGFKSYIEKRITSQLISKLEFYTTSDLIPHNILNKTLLALKQLNKS